MATQGPLTPTAASVDTSVGVVTWTNPTNAEVSDAVYATATGLDAVGNSSKYLLVSSFGFTIPTGSIILGILVEIQKLRTGSAACTDDSIRIVKGGVISGDNKATGTNWPTSESYVSSGGAADLWGLSWTAADINASNFGVVVSAVGGSPVVSSNANVDCIRITVTYTPPFTASGAATIGAATAAGTATFTKPVYTASAAATLGAVTAAGTATFTKPVYTAHAAAILGAVTASGASEFVPPAQASALRLGLSLGL